MNSDKWKLELQPEEFTDEPHQALINQGNSLIPIYDTVTVRGRGLIFSIVHLPPLTVDSPFTFTVLIIFFADTF